MCCVSPGAQVLAGTAEKMKNFAVIYLVGLFPSLLWRQAGRAGRREGDAGARVRRCAGCSACCRWLRVERSARVACLLAPAQEAWCCVQVDIQQVPDFNAMYELYDPCT